MKRTNQSLKNEIDKAITRVLDSGNFIRGEECQSFEKEYSQYIGTDYSVGCGNGLDALTLIFRALIITRRLKPGDEVILPANTFIADYLALSRNGLIPVPVEPEIDTFQLNTLLIDKVVSPRTKALLIVHLYGRCAYNHIVAEICKKHNLILIEDNAQAHGCEYIDTKTGSLGMAAAHSFYPTKNLGAMSDAGAITTNDEELSLIVKSLANYGSTLPNEFEYIGINSRLDELQAAILRVKLKYLDSFNERRNEIARIYFTGIRNPLVTMQKQNNPGSNVFHQFPVLCTRRDELREHLYNNGVETMIHYPIAPHRQPCYSELNKKQFPLTDKIHREVLSLPISPDHTDEEIKYTIEAVNSFSS